MVQISPMLYIFSILLCQVQSKRAVYCTRLDEPNTGFCVGVSGRPNVTTFSHDLQFRLEAWLRPQSGWVSVGIGGQMNEALMFVVFRDVSKNSGSGAIEFTNNKLSHHNSPIYANDGPEIVIQNATFEDTGLLKLDFTCYSCNIWSTLDVSSTTQSFIWAVNMQQPFDDVSINNVTLEIHSHRGQFNLDVRNSFKYFAEFNIPAVLRDTGSTAWDRINPPIRREAAKLHGFICSAVLLLILPISAVIETYRHIILSWSRAIEIIAAIFILVGVSSGIFAILQANSILLHLVSGSSTSAGIIIIIVARLYTSTDSRLIFQMLYGLTVLAGLISLVTGFACAGLHLYEWITLIVVALCELAVRSLFTVGKSSWVENSRRDYKVVQNEDEILLDGEDSLP